jgi:hypothetical protein
MTQQLMQRWRKSTLETAYTGRSQLRIHPIDLDKMGEDVVTLSRDSHALGPERIAGLRTD